MFRSERYLAFVRLQPCCAPGCREQADHAHHFGRRHGGGGIGIKAHDTFVVPLCSSCHRLVHQDGMIGLCNAPETEAYFYRIALALVTRWWLMRKERKAA